MSHVCPSSHATGHAVEQCVKRQSPLSSTPQCAGCIIVSIYCKCLGFCSTSPSAHNMRSQERSSMDLSQKLTNVGWMEMYEKAFWLFQAKLKQLEWKGDKEASFMFLQQQLIHNQNKTAPTLILTLAFTQVVFMAQWAQEVWQAPYGFKNSLNTIGLACTATYIHTLVKT